jgi:hypothetical protein
VNLHTAGSYTPWRYETLFTVGSNSSSGSVTLHTAGSYTPWHYETLCNVGSYSSWGSVTLHTAGSYTSWGKMTWYIIGNISLLGKFTVVTLNISPCNEVDLYSVTKFSAWIVVLALFVIIFYEEKWLHIIYSYYTWWDVAMHTFVNCFIWWVVTLNACGMKDSRITVPYISWKITETQITFSKLLMYILRKQISSKCSWIGRFAHFVQHQYTLQPNKNPRSKMFQLPLMANNTKPIFFPCYSHTPFPTSFISDYHSHSFSHPSLLFSFIVANPTLVDRVTLFFSSLSRLQP